MVEAEADGRRLRRSETRRSRSTVLRCANVLGPDVDTAFTRMFRPAGGADDARLRPAAAVRPRGRRRPRARARRASTARPGVYNVAADGVLALSEIIGLLGKRRAADPAAVGHRADRRPLRRLGFRIPDEAVNQLRFGRGVDNRLFKATGFDYGYTTREAVLQARRAHAARAGDARAPSRIHVRARGGGVPALEPSRAPRAARRARRGRRGPRAARDLTAGRRPGARPRKAGCAAENAGIAPRFLPKLRLRLVGRRAQIALAAVVGVAAGHSGRAPTRSTAPTRTRSPTGSESAAWTSAGCPPTRRGIAVNAKLVEAARQAGHRDLRGHEVRRSARTGSSCAPTSTAWSTRRSRRAARAASRRRVWRYATGGTVDARSRRRSATPPTRSTGSSSEVAEQIDRAPQDATVEPHPDVAQRRSPARTGSRSRPATLRSRASRRDRQPAPPDRLADRSSGSKPAGHDRRPGPEVPGLPHRRPRQLPASALAEPEGGQDLHDRRRPGRASRRPPGEYTIDDKQVNPSWHVPDSRLGRRPRRARSSRRAPTTRSRRAGWASTPAPASTAPTRRRSLGTAASHGCIRMAIPDVEELYPQVPLGTPIYIGN